MKKSLNSGISRTKRVGAITNTMWYEVVDVEVVERDVFEQSGLISEDRSSVSIEEAFQLVEAYAIIPYEGPRGVKALREQFQGTSMEAVFDGFPDGQAVHVLELEDRLSTWFDGSQPEIGEATYVTHKRVYRYINDDFCTDMKAHPDWQQRAEHHRQIAEQLSPGFAGPNRDRGHVVFTPRITNKNELVILEARLDQFAANVRPASIQEGTYHEEDKTNAPFPQGRGYFYVDQSQLRVMVADEHGRWNERGCLAFLNVQWLELSQRAHAAKPGRYNRANSGMLDVSYPSSFFDPHILYGDFEPVTAHAIITALPSDLRSPDPASLHYIDKSGPEMLQAPASDP